MVEIKFDDMGYIYMDVLLLILLGESQIDCFHSFNIGFLYFKDPEGPHGSQQEIGSVNQFQGIGNCLRGSWPPLP